MPAAITYIRVSRPRQGRSGLGLEAQHEAIARFAEAHGFRIAETFSEVERGRAPMRSTAFGGYSFPGVGQYEVITGIATGEVNPGDEKNMVSPIFCARRGSLTATSNTSTIPRMEVRHTSERERGQVYVPAINYILLVAVLVTVLLFRTSNALGAAYGIAVTGTMVVDTTLAHKTARQFGKMHSAAVTHRGRLVLHARTVRRNNGAQVQHPGLMLGDQPRDKQQADARNSKLARFWSV